MKGRPESIGFLLAIVSRLMRRRFEQRLQDTSLSLPQARALVFLSHHEGVRQVTLADFLEVQPITLVHLIDQLEAAGLVERRPDPADRRAHRLYLTEAAAGPLADAEKIGHQVRAEAARGLSTDEVDAVMHALRTMRENLRPETIS